MWSTSAAHNAGAATCLSSKASADDKTLQGIHKGFKLLTTPAGIVTRAGRAGPESPRRHVTRRNHGPDRRIHLPTLSTIVPRSGAWSWTHRLLHEKQ
ncbi:hypothetical protein GCM10010517_76180 [Streptosporangium fragile]|uniref:Uncharacterized protein n=1 Tax=Streptosporangium fragile TaxID=46186 RepID=A0ABN3WCC3_9ACTN